MMYRYVIICSMQHGDNNKIDLHFMSVIAISGSF